MTGRDVDIFISGGGIAGLVAAAALGNAGFSVLLAAPEPAPERHDGPSADPRSTAFLLPSRALLEEAGLWPALECHAVRLDALRVVDTAGWPPKVTESRSFRPTPSDSDERTFGWNIPNRIVRTEAVRVASGHPDIELAFGTGFRSMLTRTGEALVTLTNGRRLRARLVVGADGRDSPVRDAAGIGARTTRYGQKALAFEATHAVPHRNVSTEIYGEGGAFTTVPLPDAAGRPSSAVVWMNSGAGAQALAKLSTSEFDAEMTARSCGLLGPMERVGQPRVWPVLTRQATRMVTERTALVAEAAHVLPPIGAQGLNLSLRDISVLLDLARADPGALGSATQLARYAKSRETEIPLLVRTIDLFNRVCRSSNPGVQAIRRAGLIAAHDIAPLHRTIERIGMGGHLPARAIIGHVFGVRSTDGRRARHVPYR